VCVRISAGSHRARRSPWLKSVARVDVGAEGDAGEQRFVLLVPWMNSPRPGDPPGAAAPPPVP
jgi:hypothetical protein